jgi:polyhydroxybutyrate depolymerase
VDAIRSRQRRAAGITVIALLAVLTLAGAACSDDRAGDAAPSDTSAPAVETPRATATTPRATTATAPTTTAGRSGPTSGWQRGTGEFGGIGRTWAVYVPSSLPATPVPLVVGLHGGLGSADTFRRDTRFDQLAEREGFIVVFPEAVDGGTVVVAGREVSERSWNAIGCCGSAPRRGVDDIGFVTALVERLTGELPIDRSRVYVTGSSNGAMLTAAIACRNPGFAAAYVMNAGATMDGGCAPRRAVNLLSIHGDADENVPITGGTGTAGLQPNMVYPSLPATLAPFLRDGRCGEPARLRDDASVTTERWACSGDAEVVSMVLHGGGHGWPGAPESLLGRPRSTSIDASAEAWTFVRRHRS